MIPFTFSEQLFIAVLTLVVIVLLIRYFQSTFLEKICSIFDFKWIYNERDFSNRFIERLCTGNFTNRFKKNIEEALKNKPTSEIKEFLIRLTLIINEITDEKSNSKLALAYKTSKLTPAIKNKFYNKLFKNKNK